MNEKIACLFSVAFSAETSQKTSVPAKVMWIALVIIRACFFGNTSLINNIKLCLELCENLS